VTAQGSAPAGALSYVPGTGAILPPGAAQVLTATAAETDYYNAASASVQIDVLYLSTGFCNGEPGHTVLGKIDPKGSSVFKVGSTVPVLFRVCDVNGNSVGIAGTVHDFRLVQIVQGTVSQEVNEPVTSNTSNSQFRWDPNAKQWVFNISTDGLPSNATYYYQILLVDGSSIFFRFGLQD
jgi:hypothetical protein